MRVTHRHSRHVLTAVALAAIVGCVGDPTQPTPPNDTTHVVGSIAITGPTEITGPGVVRASVAITDSKGVGIAPDSIATTITTTGPFTASWDNGSQALPGTLSIVANAPGTGSVTVSANGKSGSIAINAVALSFQSISAAAGFACGIAVDGRAWCWGGNDTGELGATTVGDCNGAFCQYGGNRGNPTPLPVATTQKFTSIVSSGLQNCTVQYFSGVCGASCALTATGDAYCWGDTYSSASPLTIPLGAGMMFSAMSVVTGEGTGRGPKTCGLSVDGTGYCFAPNATPIGNGMTFKSLSVGRNHSCGVAISGDVYCWGSNALGNLGIGSTDTLTHADPVRAVAPTQFTSVAVGDNSTCALDTTGTLYCWGQGNATPQPIHGGGTYVAFSLARSSLVCGLTAAGAASCWTSFSGDPSSVSVPEPLVNISVGGTTGCGVSTSHVGYCWGSNYVGSKVGQ